MPSYTGTDEYAVHTLVGAGITSVAFSSDSTRIFAARADGTIDVFDATTHALITSWDVGVSLRGMSLSEDGSFLLAVEYDASADHSIVHRISTDTGDVEDFVFDVHLNDVEIVDADTAILTGTQEVTQPNLRLDLSTGTISPLEGSTSYSGTQSLLVEDGHLTLIAEPGISSGPLFLYDDRTDSVVAYGDNYQPGVTIGFNNGSQAVSEAAGLVLQHIFETSLNVYDLNLQAIGTIHTDGWVDGLEFDPEGDFLYAHIYSQGILAKYDVSTWDIVDSFELDVYFFTNRVGYGDQIHLSNDGTYITVLDNDDGTLNLIDLSARNETFNGTSGADRFDGRDGNDRYVVNHSADVVVERAGNGTDQVVSAVSYALRAHAEVEDLRLAYSTDWAPLNLTGSSSDNTITGNDGANELYGLGGADSLIGRGADDLLFGGGGDDRIWGGADNDYLAGERGRDELFGGAGNDTLYINARSDVVAGEVYDGGSGFDRLRILVDEIDLSGVTLAGIEAVAGISGGLNLSMTADQLGGIVDLTASVLTLTTAGRVAFGAESDIMAWTIKLSDFGNTLDLREVIWNTGVIGGDGDDTVFAAPASGVRGNGGNDVLHGALDSEWLDGGAGNDRLNGGGHDDTLLGGEGEDRLDGGTGADAMRGGTGDDVYFVDDARDVVVEHGDAGVDKVVATVDFTLSSHVETLVLRGAARTGTGNGGNNELIGEQGDDILSGLGGADVLVGGIGRDRLDGGAAADELIGGAGRDWLTGGTGGDMFLFREGDTAATHGEADRILDFNQADGDRIGLSRIDANTVLDGDQAFAWIGGQAFSGTAGELRFANKNGQTYVMGDTDGDGVPDLVLALAGTIALTDADFVL